MTIPESLHTALEAREEWLLSDKRAMHPRETLHHVRLEELSLIRSLLLTVSEGEEKEL
jgi:hypothetical protein